MRTVRVNKTDLLDKLNENREEHERTFQTAVAAFQREAYTALRDRAAELERGGFPKAPLHFDLPVPRSFTTKYDSAIAMLNMSADDVVELTQAEFEQYALDNWDWRDSFAASTTRYAG